MGEDGRGSRTQSLAPWPRLLALMAMAALLIHPAVPLWPLSQPSPGITLERFIVGAGALAGLLALVRRKEFGLASTSLVAAGYLVALKGGAFLGTSEGMLGRANNALVNANLDWAMGGWGNVFWLVAVVALGIEGGVCRGRGWVRPPGLRLLGFSLAGLVLLMLFTAWLVRPLDKWEVSQDLMTVRRVIEAIGVWVLVSITPGKYRVALGLWLGVVGLGRWGMDLSHPGT